MAIKHLKAYSKKELKKLNPDLPIWERPESWKSPLAVILIVGYVIFGIGYAIFWVLRLLLFSWMRPFTNASWLCKLGLHKYRYYLKTEMGYKHYYCLGCHEGLESSYDYELAGIPIPQEEEQDEDEEEKEETHSSILNSLKYY